MKVEFINSYIGREALESFLDLLTTIVNQTHVVFMEVSSSLEKAGEYAKCTETPVLRGSIKYGLDCVSVGGERVTMHREEIANLREQNAYSRVINWELATDQFYILADTIRGFRDCLKMKLPIFIDNFGEGHPIVESLKKAINKLDTFLFFTEDVQGPACKLNAKDYKIWMWSLEPTTPLEYFNRYYILFVTIFPLGWLWVISLECLFICLGRSAAAPKFWSVVPLAFGRRSHLLRNHLRALSAAYEWQNITRRVFKSQRKITVLCAAYLSLHLFVSQYAFYSDYHIGIDGLINCPRHDTFYLVYPVLIFYAWALVHFWKNFYEPLFTREVILAIEEQNFNKIFPETYPGKGKEVVTFTLHRLLLSLDKWLISLGLVSTAYSLGKITLPIIIEKLENFIYVIQISLIFFSLIISIVLYCFIRDNSHRKKK